ncbi:unnamed protein product [Brassica rapa]|uniref:Uncharacterized protein n=1 Tax=Brassica campestris TaxID=3711 RepID=A0A3P6BQG8_BRACM|nr:unnamed protein product [Brassica rapa]VDD01175.1 unnamed protein product [Brassica rapa]
MLVRWQVIQKNLINKSSHFASSPSSDLIIDDLINDQCDSLFFYFLIHIRGNKKSHLSKKKNLHGLNLWPKV